MRLLKLKQFGLVLCCIVSLFVPTFATCICPQMQASSAHCHSEHQSSQKASCEHHQEDSGTAASPSETIQTTISEPDCCCASPAPPRAFAKSETVKIEKQVAVTVQPSRIEINITPQVVSVKTIVFARPFYLSDSFYNISPGRAPPRL